MLKFFTVLIHTDLEGQQFMQWSTCFFQQPSITKVSSMKGSCRSADVYLIFCRTTETPSIFYFFFPSKNTQQIAAFGHSYNSCGREKQRISLNLCYLNYCLLYGCVDWRTIHSNKLNRWKTLPKS